MYRDISIPAGEDNITLSFNWIGEGEWILDKMRVWIVPTSFTPTSGTAITSSGVAPGGNVQVGATDYSSQATWTNTSFKLPVAYAGTTVRLVFEWTNDGSLGTQPPAAVDNISLTSIATPICAAQPTAQPTALTLNSSSGTVNGSFTAAVPAPSNYLVVYNTTGVTPTITDGIIYTVGATIAGGNTIADTDANTNFSVSGVASNTTYYFFVFAFNYNVGTCNPNYLTASPLTGNLTTGLIYCSPVSTPPFDNITSFKTTGAISNINYASATSNPNGYGDLYATNFVSQIAGGTINFVETFDFDWTHGFRIWVDYNNDGTFAAGELEFSSGATAANHAGSFVVNAVAAGDYRMRIRAWESNNNPDPCTNIVYGEAIDFKLTVLPTLPCAGVVSNIVFSAITSTTATITWTAASPAPASGYQISVTTANGTPVGAGTHTTAAGVTTINVTGLTAETTYYVYVRANCGATQGHWVNGGSFKTLCAPGTGTGVSAMGCPSVISGGLGLNGADPAAITCASSSCVDLEATYLKIGDTTSYTVQSIPYAPPYQYGCLTNPVSVNTDDVYSPLINLPFNFCFFGNSYNQCVIGSNGILTFDTTKAGTSSGYSFSTNLPSIANSLIGNSIYGVYHDIDPRYGGTVAWELITLTSGCRALVASWKDIPMYSNNSLLYTGMMVLYENTNAIEIYIKEKKIDGTWNGGNAIVGIQNAAGTVATVAPGRNALDTDWTTTNEAWRFTPSGGSLTSIKWYEGAGTAGPVVGTTDTINVCPSVTTTYTAEVTYNLSCGLGTVKVTDQTTVTVSNDKTWNGSVSTAWNTANNWTPPGVPTSTQSVSIPNVTNDPIIGSGVNAYACSLTVQNGGLLTINSNNNLTVTNAVNVNAGGQFIVNDDASLIQVNNVANTGNIQYKRIADLRLQDYCYWSSPVGNLTTGTFPVQNVSPLTPAGYIFKWETTTTNANGGQGNWVATTENMVPTKGYILRAPTGFTNTATSPLTATFVGVPNNGTFTPTIFRGTDFTTIGTQGIARTATDDNWNLLGNPYPSAIGVNEFLDANSFAVPTNDIQGFVKIWTHGQLPTNATDPFYENFVSNYYASDYITINKTAATSGPGDYKIGGGQSFMVLMDNGAAGSGTVTFNNSMRSANFANTQFYKTSGRLQTPSLTSNSRIWLDLVTPNGLVNRTVVGYVNGATNDKDNLYDAFTDYKPSDNFYSLIDNEPMLIQGRTLPFRQEDTVPLGLKTSASGNYHIAIHTTDGLFSNSDQNIYLEDKQLNRIHDLKQVPYLFTSDSTINNDRFILRFTNKLQSREDSNTSGTVKIITTETIDIISSNETIKEFIVYDVLGKVLIKNSAVNKKQVSINELRPTTNMLFVKVTLESGNIEIKKVIY